jgi:hypothetical protein
MKPRRDFRFAGKKEIFACVGFRYDQPQSIEYNQFKKAESVAGMVHRLLTMENGADIISIRRVYLLPESEPKTNDPATHVESIIVLDTEEARE